MSRWARLGQCAAVGLTEAMAERVSHKRLARLVATASLSAAVLVPLSYGAALDLQDTAPHLLEFPPSGLAWSHVLGGQSAEDAYALALDSSGALVFAGTAGSSTLPTTAGAFSATKRGAFDGFLARVEPGGLNYDLLTYLGGTGSESIFGVVVDKDGTIIVVGQTTSPDFPTTSGGYDTEWGGNADGFVARLDGTGSNLIGMSFLGGPANDNALAVGLDLAGNVFVAGEAGPGFPSATGVDGRPHAGGSDLYVARLTPDLGSADYITLIGGSGTDCEWCSLGVTPDGQAVIVSQTDSSDLPTTAGGYDTTFNGDTDAYVARLTPDGASLDFATYLGGSGRDCAEGCAIDLDRDGNVWIAGTTLSADFPSVPATSGSPAGADAFVARLEGDGQNLGLSRRYRGSQTELVRDIHVTDDAAVLVLLITTSGDLPVTSDAFDATANGDADLALLQLEPAAGDIDYGTYIGTRQEDGWLLPKVVSGPGGSIYVAGGTFSSAFPGSGGSAGGQVEAKGDAFALKFAPEPTPTPTALPPPSLYLPIALRERCERPFVDVALVIDASSSMGAPDPSGGPLLETVLAGAREFIRTLQLEESRDRVAVVSFNSGARLHSALTHDSEAALDALDAVTIVPGTEIHLGVEVAAQALSESRPAATRLLVLLSDGNAPPEHSARAAAAASAARAKGILTVAVGYGEPLNLEVLTTVAGDAERVQVAGSSDDISGFLAQVVAPLRCGGSVYWPHTLR